MASNTKIDLFKSRLSEAKTESACAKIADQFSDEILEYSGFPDEYLNFLVEILTDKNFYNKNGIFHFLSVIGVDTDIMTPLQLKSISDAITSSFVDYEDEMMCLTSCDFIARYYPKDEASKILLNLKKIENDKTEKGFADDGLRTLKDY